MKTSLNQSVFLIVVATAFGMTLDASTAVAQHVYFTSSGKIQRTNLDGSEERTFETEDYSAALAFDQQRLRLYWASWTTRVIRRAALNGTSLEDVAVWEIAPFTIAVDSASGKLYWTQPDHIRRVNLDGTAEIIVASGLNELRGLALDLLREKMYWVDREGPSAGTWRIQRADLDGGNITTILSGLSDAFGIVVDETSSQVYWANNDAIFRADLDGANVQHVVDAVGVRLLALDTANSKIYWTRSVGVSRANLDGTDVQAIASGFLLTGLALDLTSGDCNGNSVPDAEDLATGFSPDCDGNGSPDECDLSDGAPDCNLNGVPDSCDIKDGASEDCSGDGIPDECDSDCNENTLPDSCDIFMGISIDADSDGVPDECGKIYFSTWHDEKSACPGSNRLRRMNPDGSNLESIAATTGYRTQPAVDVAGGKIYWNGWHFFGHIKRSNLDGSNEETLILSDIFNAGPTTIALDLIDRKMYWTWTDYEAQTGKIQRANLDGTEVEDLVTGLGSLVYEMAVDPFAKKVYWTDPRAKSIQRADLNGSNVETVYTSTTTRAIYRFALDFCEQRIYFIRFGDLHRIDFEGSNYEYVADNFYLIALDLHRRRAYGGWRSILVSDLDGLNRESVGPDDPVGCIQGIAVDSGTGDCNGNGVDDACELAYGFGADCNSNGVLDACDISDGISEDCTGNGIADECEPDCNTNGVADSCDIAAGISGDCNGNGIPDDCEIADGTSEDCNHDGVPDECDLPLDTSEDCNGNGVHDACEPDCNGNGIPNECDIADGTSVDLNGDGVPDDCQCPPSPPRLEPLPTPKNRYLTLSESNAGQQIARRVTFVDLPRPFDLWNGYEMWVGPISVVSESGASVAPVTGVANFNVARLQCTPHYADWNALGAIHVFHEGIVPGGIYRVDAIDEICDSGDPASFSATIGQTTAIWGDTLLDLSSVPPAPPEGAVNIVDALGVLGRFSSAPGAIIKARADLEPACVDLKINVTDVLASLAGFLGLPYPFAPTATDPCDSTCVSPLP